LVRRDALPRRAAAAAVGVLTRQCPKAHVWSRWPAQLRGNNQGLVKLVGPGLQRNPAAQPVREVRRSATAVLLDGGQNIGMVVQARALELAMDLARRSGVGVVGSFNTCTSTGAIGYYADRAAREGFVAFVFAGSRPTVTTEGAREAIFGTNPLAIGAHRRSLRETRRCGMRGSVWCGLWSGAGARAVAGLPSTDANPVVLDMATSAMAWYGLVEAETAGRSIPDNVALDAEGRPTTSPSAALQGVLRPFDRGPKSSGLSFVVEGAGEASSGAGPVPTAS